MRSCEFFQHDWREYDINEKPYLFSNTTSSSITLVAR